LAFDLFVFACMGALVFLCIWELRRFTMAREDPAALPYPRARLIRRELTALLGIAILAGLAFKPDSLSDGQDLAWYGVCMILTLIVLLLAVQDLREASLAAVDAHRQFQEKAAEHIEELLQESRRVSKKRKRRRR